MKAFKLKIGDIAVIRNDLVIGKRYGELTFHIQHAYGSFPIIDIRDSEKFSEYELKDGGLNMYYSEEMIDWDKTIELNKKGDEVRMLDLKLIKEMLSNEIEVELECIDTDKYLNLEKNWRESRQEILDSGLIVTGLYGINESNLEIKGISRIIPNAHFNHFKIKEERQTFDDLIDIAVQALKDGVIEKRILKLSIYQIGVNIDGRDYSWSKKNVSEGIKFFKSLYTEKFVIVQNMDISKLKGEPKITLANGNEFIAKDMKISSNERGMFAICFTDIDGYEMVYSLFELKGATVTQKVGK